MIKHKQINYNTVYWIELTTVFSIRVRFYNKKDTVQSLLIVNYINADFPQVVVGRENTAGLKAFPSEGRGPVASQKTSTLNQEYRLPPPPLFPNPDCYVFGDFTISPSYHGGCGVLTGHFYVS